MKYVKGNLLEAPTQALVNTVNTVGVMGKGIALQFKEAFPNNFKLYQAACKNGTLQPGQLLVVREQTLSGKKVIVNFPTKTEWYLKSKYEYIETGLQALVEAIKTHEIKSIAIPPLGCGNGGLQWPKVRTMIEQYLGEISDVEVVVYEPNEAIKSALKKQQTIKQVNLTPARAMMLYAMYYYEATGEHISLFVANKLAYFLQRLGERDFNNLKFEARQYGPYSVQVEHFLHTMNGKYLKGLEQMNAQAFEPLDLQYDTFHEVQTYVQRSLAPNQVLILDNLTRLVDGFQSTLALEILASVDYIRRQNPGIQGDHLVTAVQEWSDRKRKLFQERYIKIAENHLNQYSLHLHFEA